MKKLCTKSLSDFVNPDARSGVSLKKTPGVEETPRFTVTEVAKVFFARSSHWLRWRERRGFLSDGRGRLVVDHRTDGGSRYYTLHDIDLMARTLYRNHAIGYDQLVRTLVLVQIMLQIHHAEAWPESTPAPSPPTPFEPISFD